MVTINNNTYSLTRTELGNVLMLTKNKVPMMTIPEHFFEDFVQLLSHAGAAAKFLVGEIQPGEDQNKVNILTGTKPDQP